MTNEFIQRRNHPSGPMVTAQFGIDDGVQAYLGRMLVVPNKDQLMVFRGIEFKVTHVIWSYNDNSQDWEVSLVLRIDT